MELCKEALREMILADTTVTSGRQLSRKARAWVADEFGSFELAVKALSLEGVMKDRTKHGADRREWIARALRYVLKLGITSTYELRKCKDIELPPMEDLQTSPEDDCLRLSPQDFRQLERRIYDEFGTFRNAIMETGNQRLYHEALEAKSKDKIYKKRALMRALLEEMAESGQKISIADRGSPLRAVYCSLLRLGEAGHKAIRTELHRIWRMYGVSVYDPAVLPVRITMEQLGRIEEMMSSVSSMMGEVDEEPHSVITIN